MYTYAEHGDAIVVNITGPIDIQSAQNLKDWIISNFFENGKSRIIIDLTHCGNIDSYGLGILVSIYKRAVLQNGYLRVVAPDRNTRTLFEITGLERIIKIYNSLSEAMSE